MRVSWRRGTLIGACLVMLCVGAACGSSTGENNSTTSSTESAAGTSASGAPPSQADIDKGKQLFTQFSCSTCHNTATDTVLVGPSLKGIFGREVPLDNGKTAKADAAYLRESILKPDAKTVKGFSKGLMSSSISGEESKIQEDGNLDALVAYIESLK